MADLAAWIEKNKARWTRVYDEVIAPDLEEEWKKRSEAHELELKQKSEDQRSLLNHINEMVLKNARLVAENETLKHQLCSSGTKPGSDSRSGSRVKETSTVSTGDYQDLTNKYNELSNKFQDLSQKIKYLERKNHAVMQKNKDMKDSVRAWQEYADRQAGRQKSKTEAKVGEDRTKGSVVSLVNDDPPHIPSSPGSFASTRTPLRSAEPDRSLLLPDAPRASPEHDPATLSTLAKSHVGQEDRRIRRSSGSVTPKPSELNRTYEDSRRNSGDALEIHHTESSTAKATTSHQDPPLHSAYPSSSQTTVDEGADHGRKPSYVFATSKDDDDEIPEFLSERSLKRKRGQSSKVTIYNDHSSDGTPVKPFRVKEEPLSSPPHVQDLIRKDTIDLDDMSHTALRTPRHQRHKPPHHAPPTSASRHQRSNSAPFSQALERQDTLLVQTARVADLNMDCENLAASCNDTRASSAPSHSVKAVNSILQPVSSNILPSSHDEPPHKRVRESRESRRNKHRFIAESGEEALPADENATGHAPTSAREKLNRILNRRNGSYKPERAVDSATTTPLTTKIKVEFNDHPPSTSIHTIQTPNVETRRYKRQSGTRSSTRDSPATHERPLWTLKTPETRSSVRKSPTSTISGQPRLRNKPVAELSIQDFKVNPAYNQGYSYAFSETVRKRGDRMCLPGCTNPQCCGSTFRTLAEAQAALSSSQEEALLEDYLGEAYDNMNLTQMASDERDELVLQARTRKMAKEAGKHRQAYEGRRTPPGFWRVDFPTTQEQEDDREKAKEQEKNQVQERWLEAQRKGGKWIFRDE